MLAGATSGSYDHVSHGPPRAHLNVSSSFRGAARRFRAPSCARAGGARAAPSAKPRAESAAHVQFERKTAPRPARPTRYDRAAARDGGRNDPARRRSRRARARAVRSLQQCERGRRRCARLAVRLQAGAPRRPPPRPSRDRCAPAGPLTPCELVRPIIISSTPRPRAGALRRAAMDMVIGRELLCLAARVAERTLPHVPTTSFSSRESLGARSRLSSRRNYPLEGRLESWCRGTREERVRSSVA